MTSTKFQSLLTIAITLSTIGSLVSSCKSRTAQSDVKDAEATGSLQAATVKSINVGWLKQSPISVGPSEFVFAKETEHLLWYSPKNPSGQIQQSVEHGVETSLIELNGTDYVFGNGNGELVWTTKSTQASNQKISLNGRRLSQFIASLPGDVVVAATSRGALNWVKKTGAEIKIIKTVNLGIEVLTGPAALPNHNIVTSTGDDNGPIFWHSSTGQEVAKYSGEYDTITAMPAVLADSSTVFASRNGIVMKFDGAEKLLWKLGVAGASVYYTKPLITPENKILVSAHKNGKSHLIWISQSGELLKELALNENSIAGCVSNGVGGLIVAFRASINDITPESEIAEYDGNGSKIGTLKVANSIYSEPLKLADGTIVFMSNTATDGAVHMLIRN